MEFLQMGGKFIQRPMSIIEAMILPNPMFINVLIKCLAKQAWNLHRLTTSCV